jgi:predicted nucleic acid-binding protein
VAGLPRLKLSLKDLGRGGAGCDKRNESDAVRRLTRSYGLPAEAAEYYGEFRSALEQAGTPIGPNDLWIAAHARAEGLTLVTNSEHEFRRIKGLKVKNWAS